MTLVWLYIYSEHGIKMLTLAVMVTQMSLMQNEHLYRHYTYIMADDFDGKKRRDKCIWNVYSNNGYRCSIMGGYKSIGHRILEEFKIKIVIMWNLPKIYDGGKKFVSWVHVLQPGLKPLLTTVTDIFTLQSANPSPLLTSSPAWSEASANYSHWYLHTSVC